MSFVITLFLIWNLLYGYYPEIQALEDCMILKMERNYFLKSIKQDGELCFEVLHEICGKFFGASLRSDQKYFYDSSTRLMIYIINLKWRL